MSIPLVPLGDIISPAPIRRAGDRAYPLLSMTMRDGLVAQAEKFKKRVASRETSNYRVVKRGELVVGFPIDEAVLATQQIVQEGIVSPAYAVWSINGTIADEIYLERFLRSPEAISYYKAHLRGTTARRRTLPPDKFRNMPVPLPSLKQQRNIVRALHKVDEIRRRREQAFALADDFLKSVFVEMFGRPTHPNRALSVLPLGKICRLFAGNSLPAGETYVGQHTGLLLLKVGDLSLPGNDQVVTSAREWIPEKARTGAAIVAPKDSIVFPKRGGAIATNKKRVLGRPCVLDPNLMAVAPKNDAPISYPYLRTWLELLDLASISNGSTVPQLNKGDLSPLEMSIPDSDTLDRFNSIFHRSSKLREKQSDDLRSADALFSALSQRAFRGEL